MYKQLSIVRCQEIRSRFQFRSDVRNEFMDINAVHLGVVELAVELPLSGQQAC